MKRPAKAKSPYARYGKAPYPYQFPRCSHASEHEVVEASPLFHGRVCGLCNTVRENFDGWHAPAGGEAEA